MHPGGHAVSAGPGACILDPLGTRLSQAETRFFAGADPWGFILFARNLDNAAQIRALCAELRAAVGRDAPVFIDQEGGRVQRLRPPLARDWCPPLDFVAAAGAGAARALFLRYRLIAAELLALGIDGNCVPLADVAGPETHPFLKDRCFGTDPATVARLARAAADGTLAGGVLPVLKHIPGHGRAVVDSHHDLPVVAAGPEDLAAVDFAAFRALGDLPLAMTAHVVYAALDARPATLSPAVMGRVRDDIGFGGLVMTDDIGMRALSGPLEGIAAEARAAGCDVVLHCNGALADKARVAEGAGRLDGAGQDRAARALAARRTPQAAEIGALEAELAGLVDRGGNG